MVRLLVDLDDVMRSCEMWGLDENGAMFERLLWNVLGIDSLTELDRLRASYGLRAHEDIRTKRR